MTESGPEADIWPDRNSAVQRKGSAVTVTNANDAPTINSNGGGATASVSVAENTTAVTTVTAIDPDAGQTLNYSISGGADADKFIIDSNTGALRFITAPNFEAPTDVGGNNVYDVTTQVSDGYGGMDTQAIAVAVTNIDEALVAPPPPPGTTAVMILRHGADGQYEIYNIGNNAILAACWLNQVGTDWHFAGLGDFNGAHTSDMLLRNSKTGGFEVYNIANNNVVSTSLVGTVGLEWKMGGFGDFNGDGSTDMMLQNVNSGGLEAYNIAHNAITGAAYMGVTGLDWKVAGFGDFFSRGHDDMLMRNVNNGGIYAYDISGNRINSATYMGIVGTDWQVMAIW
jgi:hypothetical protein